MFIMVKFNVVENSKEVIKLYLLFCVYIMSALTLYHVPFLKALVKQMTTLRIMMITIIETSTPTLEL